ncbi:MAG: UvrB/UvrC motif-containing protein [Planctomycetota bacterium]
MMCQRCQKAQATVHIDEVKSFNGPGAASNEVDEHHLCEACAQETDLPNLGVPKKSMDEVWKLLQNAALKAHKAPRQVRTCPTCGMSHDQLKRKGRVGCQDCYDTFSDYLDDLLERMHGSTEHSGRIPGVDLEANRRRQAIQGARAELERAIGAENFERAAELRDELRRLEDEGHEDEGAGAGIEDSATP